MRSVEISSPSISYTLLRTEQEWRQEPASAWQLDQEFTRQALAKIGAMRIGSTWKEPLSQTDLQLNMRFQDGSEKKAQIQLSDFAIVAFGGEQYRSSVSIFPELASDPEYFRDKKIFHFHPRSDLDTITYQSGGQKIIFQQDLSNGLWRVLEPIGMDMDLKQVFFMVNSLASAKAISFVSEPLENPEIQLSFRMLTGSEEKLEIGEEIRGDYIAQKGSERFLLSKELVQKIQKAFGQNF